MDIFLLASEDNFVDLMTVNDFYSSQKPQSHKTCGFSSCCLKPPPESRLQTKNVIQEENVVG